MGNSLPIFSSSLDLVLALSESCSPGRVVLAAGPDEVKLATLIASDLHADGVRCAVVLYGVRAVPFSLQMLSPVVMSGPADLPPGPSDQRALDRLRQFAGGAS